MSTNMLSEFLEHTGRGGHVPKGGMTDKKAVVSVVQCLFSNTVGQRGETSNISYRAQSQDRQTHNRWSDAHLKKREKHALFVHISLTSSSLSGSATFFSFFFFLSSSFFFLSLSGRMSSSQARSCCEKIRSNSFLTPISPRIYT